MPAGTLTFLPNYRLCCRHCGYCSPVKGFFNTELCRVHLGRIPLLKQQLVSNSSSLVSTAAETLRTIPLPKSLIKSFALTSRTDNELKTRRSQLLGFTYSPHLTSSIMQQISKETMEISPTVSFLR